MKLLCEGVDQREIEDLSFILLVQSQYNFLTAFQAAHRFHPHIKWYFINLKMLKINSCYTLLKSWPSWAEANMCCV